MLRVIDNLPDGFLEADATGLEALLGAPTLMHLPGRREPALFVSVLLHGNETTGFEAVQALLRRYQGEELPRALSLFVGNVRAARHACRRLDEQPDYNRIWLPGDTPEHAMTARVVEEMRRRGVFASIDIHNNTGLNPHYACVNRLDPRALYLASMFGRTVVYFIRPEGVQTAAFSALCPAVVLECGQAHQAHGAEHAGEFLEGCLHLAEFPERDVRQGDIDLYHTVAQVKVPEDISFGFSDADTDLRLVGDLDHLNFRELPASTALAFVHPDGRGRLEAWDERGAEVSERYFRVEDDEILTRVPVMPSMLTLDETVIRQDCFCYLMERMSLEEASGEQ